jgi:predicted NBD/HSP70 family sugar kinase
MTDTTEKPAHAVASKETRGTNQTGMRAQNERLVLTLIRRHGALAKAEIARLTGLSAQTVSVIMRSLEEEGLLLKGEPQRGKVGQPSVPMRLNPKGALFLGLKVGRRSTEMIVTDFLGSIIARRKRIYAYPDFEEVKAFSLASVQDLTRSLPEDIQTRIAGLGIAIPFLLWDWARVLGVEPEKMAAWQHRDLQAELSASLEMPVYLQNDATSACSAELVFGTGEQPANFLHVFIAFFIGGGVVLNGTLFPGPTGSAGAIGPLPVVDLGGNRRQLMDIASLVVLERRMQEIGLDSGILWDNPENWNAPKALLEDWTAEAANAIAHAAHAAMGVIDFEMIKIDGWIPKALRTELVAQIRARFDQMDFTGLERPAVESGTVGADARALGAASQPLLGRFLVGYTA